MVILLTCLVIWGLIINLDSINLNLFLLLCWTSLIVNIFLWLVSQLFILILPSIVLSFTFILIHIVFGGVFFLWFFFSSSMILWLSFIFISHKRFIFAGGLTLTSFCSNLIILRHSLISISILSILILLSSFWWRCRFSSSLLSFGWGSFRRN